MEPPYHPAESSEPRLLSLWSRPAGVALSFVIAPTELIKCRVQAHANTSILKSIRHVYATVRSEADALLAVGPPVWMLVAPEQPHAAAMLRLLRRRASAVSAGVLAPQSAARCRETSSSSPPMRGCRCCVRSHEPRRLSSAVPRPSRRDAHCIFASMRPLSKPPASAAPPMCAVHSPKCPHPASGVHGKLAWGGARGARGSSMRCVLNQIVAAHDRCPAPALSCAR